MKRPVKRFGMERASDAAPYAYVNARWNQSAAEWDRVLVTPPYPPDPVIRALCGLSSTLAPLLSMIGASGIDALIAPLRGPPTYWLDRCTGSGGACATIHGCRPCGADVVIVDVFGIRASDWSSAIDARFAPFAVRLHAEVSSAFTLHEADS